jgi:hypothetical protein
MVHSVWIKPINLLDNYLEDHEYAAKQIHRVPLTKEAPGGREHIDRVAACCADVGSMVEISIKGRPTQYLNKFRVSLKKAVQRLANSI